MRTRTLAVLALVAACGGRIQPPPQPPATAPGAASPVPDAPSAAPAPTAAPALTSALAPGAPAGADAVITGRPVIPATWSLAGKGVAVSGSRTMVVSGHPLASEVGVEILKQGGNAIDAAVAVGFALADVLPEAGNIGGGGFIVYRDTSGRVRALDYRETAPTGASRDMYL